MDIARILSAIKGENVSYFCPDPGSYIAKLRAKGAPERMLKVVDGFSGSMRKGEFDDEGKDLTTILGRRPADLQGLPRSVYTD
ncbi:hypothetical protein SAMN06265348_113215 [Pedobacter westerhofensis]|uniref:NmrA-like family protein n=1 Tax=Pedobacter westerhofensis TaxID=425512 RepID=A0A521FLF9_9SPHI|nr:hypothetical protein [Pedobacter westerhofensis]SMO97015.1 hypothetical protein SAMN06265348_113215 [Pedobacter westerhofensis]